MTDPCAVIFDLDGVLIDSYQAHFESWQRLAVENGIALTEEQFAPWFGVTGRDLIRGLLASEDLSDERVEALYARKTALYRERFKAGVTIMDGAVELIDALRAAGLRLGIATSGSRESTELTLRRIARHACFEAVVTGQDVRRGKPDPEPFLVAAGRLEIDVGRCVAIEDAPAGIVAARGAGMATVGLVSEGRTVAELSAADRVVRSLRELSPDDLVSLLPARWQPRPAPARSPSVRG